MPQDTIDFLIIVGLFTVGIFGFKRLAEWLEDYSLEHEDRKWAAILSNNFLKLAVILAGLFALGWLVLIIYAIFTGTAGGEHVYRR